MLTAAQINKIVLEAHEGESKTDYRRAYEEGRMAFADGKSLDTCHTPHQAPATGYGSKAG